jgi:D-glycero-D-manno-heptose 1,7-bisphosphate phosphatase
LLSGHTPKAWREFEFVPGALQALVRPETLGRPVVVASNQAAIGRGLVSRESVDEIHDRMIAAGSSLGERVDRVYYCPHLPEEGCGCRNPRPGFLERAAVELGLDLPASYLIGDVESDVLAARAVGCRVVLVRTGRGVEQLTALWEHDIDGFHLANDLSDAVECTHQAIKDLPDHDRSRA